MGTPLCWAAFRVRVLSIIQVGGGIWGQSWAELVYRATGFRLAALVDASATVREWASAELGVPVFARLEQALEGVEADAVLLASPPKTHRRLGEAALASGLHVISEKPLTLELEDAQALVDKAEHTRAQRNGRAELPLSAAAASAAGAHLERSARPAQRDPHRVPTGSPELVDL